MYSTQFDIFFFFINPLKPCEKEAYRTECALVVYLKSKKKKKKNVTVLSENVKVP